MTPWIYSQWKHWSTLEFSDLWNVFWFPIYVLWNIKDTTRNAWHQLRHEKTRINSNTNRIIFRARKHKSKQFLIPLFPTQLPAKYINISCSRPYSHSNTSIFWAPNAHGRLLFTSHSLAGSYNLNMAAIIWHYLAAATTHTKKKSNMSFGDL